MTDRPNATAQVHALFARYRATRDPRLQESLVERFLPLAQHLSRRYGTRGDDEDLEQVAAVALLKAIERFDPQHGVAFSSFAVPTILGELKRYFRDQGWMVRVPRPLQDLEQRVVRAADELTPQLGRTPTVAELASACGVGIEEIVEVQTVASAHRPTSLNRPASPEQSDELGSLVSAGDDTEYERVEDAVMIDSLLKGVSERDALMLRLRFQEDLTQSEIGARLGMSQMHVSRTLRQSIKTLQAAAENGPEPWRLPR
jgi:RNA polymerase sigma-B factor